MEFNSLEFIVFLYVVVAVYYFLPHNPPLGVRNCFLLLASWFFYACYNVSLTLFLILCTAAAYWFALKIESCDGKKRKRWMQAGVASNLAVLVFYKYLNFLLRTLHTLMSSAGIKSTARQFELMVPLGISFILFQTISYMIDVYRQEIKAEHSVLKFALYVSFSRRLCKVQLRELETSCRSLTRCTILKCGAFVQDP